MNAPKTRHEHREVAFLPAHIGQGIYSDATVVDVCKSSMKWMNIVIMMKGIAGRRIIRTGVRLCLNQGRMTTGTCKMLGPTGMDDESC